VKRHSISNHHSKTVYDGVASAHHSSLDVSHRIWSHVV
jgi:hypothetical protein